MKSIYGLPSGLTGPHGLGVLRDFWTLQAEQGAEHAPAPSARRAQQHGVHEPAEEVS